MRNRTFAAQMLLARMLLLGGMNNQPRKKHKMARRVKGKGQVASAQPDSGSRKALGAVSLKDVANALQDGRRVSIMFGQIDLKRGDEDAAWIGDALAKVCGSFHVDIAVKGGGRYGDGYELELRRDYKEACNGTH